MKLQRLCAGALTALAMAGSGWVARSLWWPAPAPMAPGFRAANWSELVPADWRSAASADAAVVKNLRDDDPRAQQLLQSLRRQLDDAPPNASLDGARISLAGYVVPLENTAEGLREFLLVPHFGACIHTPPPPANQIVHIVLAQPAKGLRSMDAVWVQGPLQAQRTDSAAGVSAYRLQAVNFGKVTESLGS